MKTIDSLPILLDELFIGLSDAAGVVVCYKSIATATDPPGKTLYTVVSVNGHLTLPAYTCAMNDLQATLLMRIMETEQQLAPEARLVFLRLAMIRCKKLSLATATCRGNGNQPNSCIVTDDCREFSNPACVNMDGPDNPDEAIEAVRRLTRPHAALWQLIIREIQLDLNCSYKLNEGSRVHIHQRQTRASITENKTKLPVRGNVALMAAFCRMLYDCKVFELNNRAKFCRIIAGMLSTRFRQEISPASFKNHFDAPAPDNFQKISAELGKMQHYVRNFKFPD